MMSADEPAPEELWLLAAKRNRRSYLLDLLIQVNLEEGRHIHLLDQDGDWCLDGRCPTSTDVHGITPPDDLSERSRNDEDPLEQP